ncbi:MAG TPA: LutB/LldF family L-lactate oxidation iron-sulfur protein [Phycisphaerae bacterium]|nr:LutB/LldF family L-lactate oxidation iron-sulfur protein [Phycisphaerae bacterium]
MSRPEAKAYSKAFRMPLPVFHPDFLNEAAAASKDKALHAALDNSVTKKDYGRRATMAELPDPEGLRELAGRIKRFTLDHLDYYLEMLERNVIANGGKVHFAADNAEANKLVVQIARFSSSKLAVKSKSMVSEETELNQALTSQGIEVVETDLGEFILQVDNDHPTHIVMPVIHKTAPDIGKVFAKFFKTPFTNDPQELAEMARVYLRDKFQKADMGISGVNFAVAETGSIVICTNEGNGRMCTSRPKVHVAIMGMEKLIPSLDDLPVFLKLLARSASGQSLTQYTSIITGPRREGEFDGPSQFHLIVMDNGRSKILAGEYRDTLRCIRCGACLNACPIYRKVGGRTYGSVYPGPIGALLTPLFNGMENHKHLPNATSLCGACFEACPVKINIPEMLIQMKADQNKLGITPRSQKQLFKFWSWGLKHSWSYALGQKLQKFMMRRLANKDGWIKKLPGPASGWTMERDFPAPPKENFRKLWSKHRREQRTLKKNKPPPEARK